MNIPYKCFGCDAVIKRLTDAVVTSADITGSEEAGFGAVVMCTECCPDGPTIGSVVESEK